MGYERVVRLIHLVFQKILEKKLDSQDRRDTIIVSLFKKCPKNLCEKYRG